MEEVNLNSPSILQTTLAGMMYFLIVGPPIGGFLYICVSFLGEFSKISVINFLSLIVLSILIIPVSYFLACLPAAITGIVSGWMFKFYKKESKSGFKYINSIICFIVGVTVSKLCVSFYSKDPILSAIEYWPFLLSGGVTGVICSILYFNKLQSLHVEVLTQSDDLY